MLALVAGRVPAAETAVREHLDRCRACRELVAVLSRGPPG
jgi:predicted anti-sigma-YlaC factor YlaD